MTATLELSHIINVDEVFSSPAPVNIFIKANNDELKALAKRLDLADLSLLEAKITLSATTGAKGVDVDDVLAKVKLKASLTQICSITTEPIEDKIKVNFSQIFSSDPESGDLESGENEDLSEDDGLFDSEVTTEDRPEPIINGEIDLGDFISQELSIRINPFPRKKDVEFEWVSKNDGHTEGEDGPFAKLSTLKNSVGDKKKNNK